MAEKKVGRKSKKKSASRKSSKKATTYKGARKKASSSVSVETEKAEQGEAYFKGRRSVPPMQTAGHGGTAIHGGYIIEVEKNKDLAGVKKFTTYSELIANVAIIAASVRYLFGLIKKASWTVEPSKEAASESQAKEVAEFVESVMHDMTTPWHQVIGRGATYVTHGFSWQEWTAKVREQDGRIGYLDVEPRLQKTLARWDCDNSGTVAGVGQESPQTFEELYIPRARSLYVVDGTFTDSPEGLGILRHAAPSAKRLQRYEQLEGFGFETDLAGVPVGRAPYTALDELVKAGKMSQEDADKAVEFLETFIKKHVKSQATGIVLDSMVYTALDEGKTPSNTQQWGVDLLKGGNTTQEEVGESINRVIREIARLFGTEGILLGESGSGSLAMAKDKSNSFGLIVDGALLETGLQYEKDFVGPLMTLNGWDRTLAPSLVPEKLQHRDLNEIAETFESMARAGSPLMPDDPAINVVRRMMGMPEVDLDAIELDAGLRGETTEGEAPKEDDKDQSTPGEGPDETPEDDEEN